MGAARSAGQPHSREALERRLCGRFNQQSDNIHHSFRIGREEIEHLRIYGTSTEVECEQVELEFLVHYKDGTESSLCGNGDMFWDSPYRSLKKTFEDPSIKFENPPGRVSFPMSMTFDEHEDDELLLALDAAGNREITVDFDVIHFTPYSDGNESISNIRLTLSANATQKGEDARTRQARSRWRMKMK